MLVYFILIVLILNLCIQYDLKQQRNIGKNVAFILLYLYLTLLIGLRYKVGGDTINYMQHWQWINDLSNWTFTFVAKYAPGYSFICSVCKTINHSFFFFQFIYCAIFNALLFIFVRKYTKYWFSSMFCIVYICYLYFSTEILRESLAVIIFSLAINSLLQKKLIKYYFSVFLAFLFHPSAIFLITLPIFSSLKFSRKYFIIYILFCIGLIILKSQLHRIAGFPVIGPSLIPYMDENSQGYLADFMSYLRLSLFPMLLVTFVKYNSKITSKYETLIAILCLFGIGAYISPTIFQRFCNYFLLIEAVVYGDLFIECLKSTSSVTKKNITIFIISFILIYGSEYILYDKYTRWIPYSSIYNPIEINRDNYNTK